MVKGAILLFLLVAVQVWQVPASKGYFRSSRSFDALGSALMGYMMAQTALVGSGAPAGTASSGDTLAKNPLFLPLLLGSMNNGGGWSTLGLMYGMGALGGAGRSQTGSGNGAGAGGQPLGDLHALAMLGLASGNPGALAPIALLHLANGSKNNAVGAPVTPIPTIPEQLERKILRTFWDRMPNNTHVANATTSW